MPERDPRTQENEAGEIIDGEPEGRTRPTAERLLRRHLSASRSDHGRDAPSSFSGDPEETEDGAGEHDRDAEDDASHAEPAIPGHNVIDRSALKAALAASGYTGSFDHLSGGEEQRVRLLLHYRASQMFRPHVIGSTGMLERLRRLDAESPNFAIVTRLVLRAAHLSFVSGRPLRLPPVLMLGAPGVGKTRYARALAEALDTSLEVITGSTIPDTGSLTGYPPAWRGAGPGRIAKAIIAAPTSAPSILVDECEKIVDHEASAFPLDRLLTLLESHSAASYEDEHLRVPMRAQHVLWLFAANSLDRLSAPFRDRVVLVTIPGLSPEQRDGVLEAMLAEVAREAGLPVALASRDALKPLRSLGLRRARLAFEIALPRAIEQERRFLTTEDLEEAVKLLSAAEPRQPVGFVRHREPD